MKEAIMQQKREVQPTRPKTRPLLANVRQASQEQSRVHITKKVSQQVSQPAIRPPSGKPKRKIMTPPSVDEDNVSFNLPPIPSSKGSKRSSANNLDIMMGKRRVQKKKSSFMSSQILEKQRDENALVSQSGQDVTVQNFLHDVQLMQQGKRPEHMSIGLQFTTFQKFKDDEEKEKHDKERLCAKNDIETSKRHMAELKRQK